MDVFKNNDYLENFINSFKSFLDSKHRISEKLITDSKKSLFIVHPYLEQRSLQTRTKLGKPLKSIRHCCKLQIKFKSQNK